MTAEIAILNKSAVALAADSAVTISTPTGLKIYESVNKLFALLKQRPVGVMIYDQADLLGVPWETIIKTYRMRRRSQMFDDLSGYADDFLDFIASTPDLIPPDLRERYVDGALQRRVDCLRWRTDDMVQRRLAGGENLSRAKVRSVLDEAIAAEHKQWNEQADGAWAARLDLPGFGRRHRSRLDALMDQIFEKLPLLKRQRLEVRRMVMESFAKVPYWHAELRTCLDPRSGIVFAGFGDKEYFPRLIAFEISGIVDGHLRIVPREQEAITVDNAAVIAPFAQREMVDAFVSGINPVLEREVRGYWQGLQKSMPGAVLDLLDRHIAGLEQTTRDALFGPLSSLVLMATRELDENLNKQKNAQVTPILDSVEYLPKDELAAMAESLVNLTSLKRRVSIDDPQTVGGPVDVAVISRGDGFVWIKRKHYFTQELNPSWSKTHADG